MAYWNWGFERSWGQHEKEKTSSTERRQEPKDYKCLGSLQDRRLGCKTLPVLLSQVPQHEMKDLHAPEYISVEIRSKVNTNVANLNRVWLWAFKSILILVPSSFRRTENWHLSRTHNLSGLWCFFIWIP